ncbi:BsuBI/PstI family type II restriction endonuclease [Xanthomonas citri]|uniref:BsuBI/PstI family type II restriction endonuclease n=2 Tax=Xanthomonas citri TaxID=346 RepID=UPI0026B8F628
MEAPFCLATSCFHKRNWILRVIFTRMSAEPHTLAKSPWETEVWVADAPSHLIHFNDVRFLVPYPERTSGSRRLHSFRLIVKS